MMKTERAVLEVAVNFLAHVYNSPPPQLREDQRTELHRLHRKASQLAASRLQELLQEEAKERNLEENLQQIIETMPHSRESGPPFLQADQPPANRLATLDAEVRNSDALGVGPTFRPKAAEELDGFFDGDGFRYKKSEVRFGRAAKQQALMSAIWDQQELRPCARRSIEDVLQDVYGRDHDTEDATFRQLCSDTQRKLDAANVALRITCQQGSIWLEPRPL
jgi:hypothetical protein